MDNDAATLVLLFTIYYFVELALRTLLARYGNLFLGALRLARKDSVFFGISMGLLISLVSTPFCARAAWNSWSLIGAENSPWSLDSKACVAARSVLWVSELNRLDFYPLYVVHHTGSIISLLSFVYFQWPLVALLIIFSTLISEVPGDLLWMLSAYIDSMDAPSPSLVRFKTRFNMFNVAQYTVIRGAGILAVVWLLFNDIALDMGSRPVFVQAYAAALLLLYAAFCAAYVVRQYRSICAYWRSHSETPSPNLAPRCQRAVHIRIHTSPSVIIVPYGLCMGVGFAALVFTSLALTPQTSADVRFLTTALQITLFCAVICARIFSLVMEDGIARLLSHPLHTIFRPGFWLHGGQAYVGK